MSTMLYRIQIPNNLTEFFTNYRSYQRAVELYPSFETIKEYSDWCKLQVGADGWNYYGMYQRTPFEFRFRREEDLLAFRLKFGL